MELELESLTDQIIGCAIRVHKTLGPGLLESIYEGALCIELGNSGLAFERQKVIPVYYTNVKLGEFRIDIVVEQLVVLELKSVERIDPVFEAQLLSYMKLGYYKVGFLLNFNSVLLKHGLHRFVL